MPRGSVVLHRVLFGPWAVEPPEPGERLRLPAWWSPLMSAIVLAPRTQYERTDAAALRAQLEGRTLYTALFDLRLLGVVELFVLVLGLPFALQRFGALGFFAALGAVLLLCMTIFIARRCAGRCPICLPSRRRGAPRRCSKKRCATWRRRSRAAPCFPGTRFCAGSGRSCTTPRTGEKSTAACSKGSTCRRCVHPWRLTMERGCGARAAVPHSSRENRAPNAIFHSS